MAAARRYACAALVLILLVSCTPSLYRRGDGVLYNADRKRVVNTAKRYLGVPYRRGGATPEGFDCSGYVMYVFRRNGMSLPRSAEDQFHRGRRIALRAAGPGDLVFFNTQGGGRITHVGIYLGRGRFIHAPSTGKKVSITRLNNPYWKRRFIGSVTLYKGRGRDREQASYGGRDRVSGIP